MKHPDFYAVSRKAYPIDWFRIAILVALVIVLVTLLVLR